MGYKTQFGVNEHIDKHKVGFAIKCFLQKKVLTKMKPFLRLLPMLLELDQWSNHQSSKCEPDRNQNKTGKKTDRLKNT